MKSTSERAGSNSGVQTEPKTSSRATPYSRASARIAVEVLLDQRMHPSLLPSRLHASAARFVPIAASSLADAANRSRNLMAERRRC